MRLRDRPDWPALAGARGARAFYTELFAAFPDNRFELTQIVVGPQGVFEAARLTGTNLGPWAGVPASGLPVDLEVLILFPWDAEAASPGSGSGSTAVKFHSLDANLKSSGSADVLVGECGK